MAERNWDIELINDRSEIKKRLESGPQLCMVLSEDLKPETHYRLIKKHYLFRREIEGEERSVILAGAFKPGVDMEPDPEKTKEAFGRDVTERLYDDLIHIDSIPYMPFCKELDVNVIDTLRSVFDIRDIEYNGEIRTAVFCYYYDRKDTVAKEGKVIFQYQVQPNLN